MNTDFLIFIMWFFPSFIDGSPGSLNKTIKLKLLTKTKLTLKNLGMCTSRPNSPGPLTDDWKVTDDSSVNFHDKFFLHFLLNFSRK